MKKHLWGAFALLSLTTGSHAVLLTFDGPDLTAGTGPALTSSFEFGYAVLAEDEDTGEDLDYYVIDNTAGPVTASTPSGVWAPGGAPDGPALDVRNQSVLLSFEAPVNLQAFSVQLDNSQLGDFDGTAILFFNDLNEQILSIEVDQINEPGFTAFSGPVSGVKSIYFPTTAFYDNLNLAPAAGPIVPEPTTLAFGLVGVALMLRKRRTA